MTRAAESLLGRPDRMWPSVTVSLAVHALVIVWALARPAGPEIDLEQKPIMARLVRLGEKKPEEFLPRKEAPPEAPAPAPAPAPNAPLAPSAPAAKPAPKALAAKPPPAAAPARGTGTSLASVLSRVRDDVQREKRYGSPDGDPAGDSDTASEGDRYLALVQRALKASYRIPATISERDRLHLKGTVVVFIEGDGRIARWRIEKPSGNGAFDDALERTLRETRLPPPPDAMRERYRSVGVQVLFQI